MWGRKARRIRELEASLQDALDNLMTVQVQFPASVWQTVRGIRKGMWYRVSYLFMASADSVSYGDVFVGEEQAGQVYFEGTTKPEWAWEGRPEEPDG